MPQDELWAASARSNGFGIIYQDAERMKGENGLLHVTPLWSAKCAQGRNAIQLVVEPELNFALPDLVKSAVESWLYNGISELPVAVRGTHRNAKLGTLRVQRN
jgi:hypothetical protein